MKCLPLLPSISFAHSLIPALSLAALAALCGSGVYWVRMLAQPLPRSTASARMQSPHSQTGKAAARLFGDSPFNLLTTIRLTGVLGANQSIAGSWHAVAVVQVSDAAPVIVAPGATITPGVTLEQVQANAILVRSAGRTHEIQLSPSPLPAQGWLR